MNVKRIAWLGLLATVGFGCEISGVDGLAEPVTEAPEAFAAESAPAGVYCGNMRCQVDEVCCNEGCGVCAKPGASCERTACLQPPECSNDSDCTVEADYCAGCDCAAINVDEQVAECPAVPVQCVMDPCLHRKAVCKNSRCVKE